MNLKEEFEKKIYHTIYGRGIDINQAIKITKHYVENSCKEQKKICIIELRKVYNNGIEPIIDIISTAPLATEKEN